MDKKSVGIIGAGIAGLTVARLLRQVGYKPVVFDKGRAPGGRVATRFSREGHVFDHGAQYISAKSSGFQSVMNGAASTGTLAMWKMAPTLTRYVGVPSMVEFPGHLARAVDVQLNSEVTAIRETRTGWSVQVGDDERSFERLVLTCPPVQAARLLGDHVLAADVALVTMSPCLTLMAAFGDGPPGPFMTRRDPDADLAWISEDSAKPMRPPGTRYVAQAGLDYSKANLEAEKPEIAAMMLPLLCDAIGRDPGDAVYTAGHRWRYARVDDPLGRACLHDDARRLFVAGDWCLGARVESAWESGVAVVEAIVGS
ncbi:MAG: FAD-dependent oxidoreductase [Pseudomonadota bacterium]